MCHFTIQKASVEEKEKIEEIIKIQQKSNKKKKKKS